MKVLEVWPKAVFSRASAVKVKVAALQWGVSVKEDGAVTVTVGFERYVEVVVMVCLSLYAACADSDG